jgi:hypothetical protein
MINLEPIYIVGTHEEFVGAIGDKLTELLDRSPDDATLNGTNVSHALAIDPSGQMHWSAFVTAEVMTRDGD